MISPSDLDDLRASLFAWDRPGLPASFAVDCARLLNVSDSAISFVGDAGQVILCASSDEARSLDEWEFTLREGPASDAAATQTTTTAATAPEMAHPWPRLAVKAKAIGYLSLAGVPMKLQGQVFATLNLQDRNGIIGPETLVAAEQIADEFASLIVSVLSRQPSTTKHPADRARFHQATGMVMVQMQVGAEAAAEALRSHARSVDRPLSDVAADVVACTLTFPST